jgi:hypothetical protein
MADIDATCSSCSKHLRISEVVDVTQVSCPSCGNYTLTRPLGDDGAPLPPPETLEKGKLRLQKVNLEPTIKEPEPEQSRGKRRKRRGHVSAAAVVTPQTGTVDLQELSKMKRAELERRKAPFIVHGLGAWVIFLLLAGISTLLRYGPWRGMGILEPCLPYAWVVVLFFHIIGVVVAFQDDLLHGVLAVAVPGYSFYYIFFLYESFIFRAVVGGILIAFGQDGGLMIWDVVYSVAMDLKEWIGSGGGGIERIPLEM